MNTQRFPPGWDEERVKRVIEHSESLSVEQQVAEDEAGVEAAPGQVVIAVPEHLLPAIRHLLATDASR